MRVGKAFKRAIRINRVRLARRKPRGEIARFDFGGVRESCKAGGNYAGATLVDASAHLLSHMLGITRFTAAADCNSHERRTGNLDQLEVTGVSSLFRGRGGRRFFLDILR